jgi:hypothetical protein
MNKSVGNQVFELNINFKKLVKSLSNLCIYFIQLTLKAYIITSKIVAEL